MTPTQLTLRELRKTGWPLVQVVERWNSFARIRQDLFGIFDVLAVRQNDVIGVQCTSWSNVSARVRKMRESDALAHWLASTTRGAEVWGWKKRNNRWEVKTIDLRLDDMTSHTA